MAEKGEAFAGDVCNADCINREKEKMFESLLVRFPVFEQGESGVNFGLEGEW